MHDMGGNIIPMFVKRGAANVYDFARNEVPGATERDRGYWRDVGTLDAYHDAHMDLVSVHPIFNLYNRRVADPEPTRRRCRRPKFVEDGDRPRVDDRRRHDHLRRDVTARWCPTTCGSAPARRVEGSVIMPGVRIGRNAVVRHAILDKNVVVPDGAQIGVDHERDAEHYTVSDGGVVVLGKNARAAV